jgi:hypothetical protein
VIDRTFSFTFLSAPFSLGHERERGGVKSEASVCIVGGNPVVEGGTDKAEDA